MSEQLSLLEDRPVKATLDVLISLEGKERGGPGISIPIRMSQQAWERFLQEEREHPHSAEELVRWAMIFREL